MGASLVLTSLEMSLLLTNRCISTTSYVSKMLSLSKSIKKGLGFLLQTKAKALLTMQARYLKVLVEGALGF